MYETAATHKQHTYDVYSQELTRNQYIPDIYAYHTPVCTRNKKQENWRKSNFLFQRGVFYIITAVTSVYCLPGFLLLVFLVRHISEIYASYIYLVR